VQIAPQEVYTTTEHQRRHVQALWNSYHLLRKWVLFEYILCNITLTYIVPIVNAIDISECRVCIIWYSLLIEEETGHGIREVESHSVARAKRHWQVNK